MKTLSYHKNKSTRATAKKKKKKTYVEANIMNTPAKFQLHPPMTSEEMICNFSLSVAVGTNQI